MEPVLCIQQLSVDYVHRDAILPAVQEVSLAIAAGECVGIVGESGSGKTKVFMAAMRLLSERAE
ncbi:MAG TPA: ATP-binding cassette domain-containing protein, partial [Steroidobacteraceae bacterium]